MCCQHGFVIVASCRCLLHHIRERASRTRQDVHTAFHVTCVVTLHSWARERLAGDLSFHRHRLTSVFLTGQVRWWNVLSLCLSENVLISPLLWKGGFVDGGSRWTAFLSVLCREVFWYPWFLMRNQSLTLTEGSSYAMWRVSASQPPPGSQRRLAASRRRWLRVYRT